MTAQELRTIQRAAESDVRRVRASHAARDEAVRVALSTGWTQAGIAEATGLTRGRIHQIVKPSAERHVTRAAVHALHGLAEGDTARLSPSGDMAPTLSPDDPADVRLPDPIRPG